MFFPMRSKVWRAKVASNKHEILTTAGSAVGLPLRQHSNVLLHVVGRARLERLP